MHSIIAYVYEMRIKPLEMHMTARPVFRPIVVLDEVSIRRNGFRRNDVHPSNQIFVSQEKNYHFWHEYTRMQRDGVGTGPPRFSRVLV